MHNIVHKVSYPFIAESLRVLVNLAKGASVKGIQYDRVVQGFEASLFSLYKVDSDDLGLTSVDRDIIKKEFKKINAVLPSKNPQAASGERVVEDSMDAILEYAAKTNKVKKLELSLRYLKAKLKRQGSVLVKHIKTLK